jgi:hypothetical protein
MSLLKAIEITAIIRLEFELDVSRNRGQSFVMFSSEQRSVVLPRVEVFQFSGSLRRRCSII